MRNNKIKLFQKIGEKYENTKTIEYKSDEYFLSGIESSLNYNILVISYSKFIFVNIYNQEILKEIKANEEIKEDEKFSTKEISPFTENCLRYKNMIIVAGIR
jgi:hypothetical protein